MESDEIIAEMDAEPRRFALALAKYLIENPDAQLETEQYGAILYRLRIVDNYAPQEVATATKALKIIIERLVNLSPMAFCSEVWIYMLGCIADCVIDPQWKNMVCDVDLRHLTTKYMDDIKDIPSTHQIEKAKEQINLTCESFILQLGVIPRIFSSIYDTELEKPVKCIYQQDWNNLKIKCDDDSTRQALRVLKMEFFSRFGEVKNKELLAKLLYFAKLARIIVRVKTVETEPYNCGAAILVFEETVTRLWKDLRDKEVQKYTIIAFDQLINTSLPKKLEGCCVEAFDNTCAWLNIPASEVCTNMEDTIWRSFDALYRSFNEDKSILPASEGNQNFGADNQWIDEMLTRIPAQLDEKMGVIQAKLITTTRCLIFILDVLIHGKQNDQVVKMIKLILEHPRLLKPDSMEIITRCKSVYKSFVDRGLLSTKEQLEVASMIIQSKESQMIRMLIECTIDEKTNKEIARLFFNNLIKDLSGDANQISSSTEFVGCMIKYMDKEVTIDIAKKLITLIVDEKSTESTKNIAIELFHPIFEQTALSSNTKKEWWMDFKSLNITHEQWDTVVTRSIQKQGQIEILSRRMLCDFKDFELDESLFVFENICQLMDDKEMIVKFYNNDAEIVKAIENCMKPENLVKVVVSHLKTLDHAVTNKGDWNKHAHSFSTILEKIEKFGVSLDPEVVNELIHLSDTIITLQIINAIDPLQIDTTELYCLARTYKSDLTRTLPTAFELHKNVTLNYVPKKSKKTSTDNVALNFKPEKLQNPGPELQELLALLENTCQFMFDIFTSKPDHPSHDTIRSWAIGLTVGGAGVPKELVVMATSLFDNDKDELTKMRKQKVMDFFLMALTVPTQAIFTMKIYFSASYIALMMIKLREWKTDKPDESVDEYLGRLSYWMEKCGEMDENQCYFSAIFMTKFADALIHEKQKRLDKNAKNAGDAKKQQSTFSVFTSIADLLFKYVHLLPNYAKKSQSPISLFASLHKLFEFLEPYSLDSTERREKLKNCLIEMIDAVFTEEVIQQAANGHAGVPQLSDKSGYSTLMFQPRPKDDLEVDEFQMLKDALKLLGRFGSDQVQHKLLQKFEKLCVFFINEIHPHLDYLSGIKRTSEEKKLIVHFAYFGEVLGYTSQLMKLVTPEYYSDEKGLKLFMLLDDQLAQNSRSDKSRGKRAKKDDTIDKKFCTFKSTERKFTVQPWYNCHTCQMIDTTGICSTCAVNCHRGHDVSFSKSGAFFCDCGSNGCASMTSAPHYPDVGNAIRGQLADTRSKTSLQKPRVVFPYTFDKIQNLDEEQQKEVNASVNKVALKMESLKTKVMDLSMAIRKGNENMLNVSKKRESVLKSFDDMEKVEILSDKKFMEYSNIDVKPSIANGVCISNMKQKELMDVMKFEDGFEIWLKISESARTTLELYVFDTRYDMEEGLKNARIENETLPFVGRRLAISGNRAIICGISEVYAIRFSPKGDVIDRAHIKLMDPTNTPAPNNTVIKAQFCRVENRQLVMIATTQYVRVYDLTLSMKSCVEEMVLMHGTVEDAVIINEEDGRVRMLILSSVGQLYDHFVTSTIADSNTMFVTNDIATPFATGQVTTPANGISIHYSHTFGLVFVSFDKGTYVAKLTNEGPWVWKNLKISTPVYCWKEAAGIISCVSQTSSSMLFYIHPSNAKIYVQKFTVNHPIASHFMMLSSKNERIYSVCGYNDDGQPKIMATCLAEFHDLWIDDVPSEKIAIEVVDGDGSPPVVEKNDLVVMNEGCTTIENVSWTSQDLSMFYSDTDLKERMKPSSQLPLTIVQKTHFKLHAKVPSTRQIVRGIRIEVDPDSGPIAMKINGVRYDTTTNRVTRIFDIRFTREESLDLANSNGEIVFEVFPRPNKTFITIRSIRIIGCDRDLMEEMNPIYYQQPILTLPNKLLYTMIDLSQSIASTHPDYIVEMSKPFIHRLYNHPMVCDVATKALFRSQKNMKSCQELFKIVDGNMVSEWKGLMEWKELDGMGDYRKKYLNNLIMRLETVRMRWTSFKQLVNETFGSGVEFLKMLRGELIGMTLQRCHVMSVSIVRFVCGYLIQGSEESEQMMAVLLDMFTDAKTYHLANELRSSIQMVMRTWEQVQKEEARLTAHYEKNNTKFYRLKNPGFNPFYGKTNFYVANQYHDWIMELAGGHRKIGADKSEIEWLSRLVDKIIDKIEKDSGDQSMTSGVLKMSDTPSHNLCITLATCFILCTPAQMSTHFANLIGKISLEPACILPLNPKAYSNYVLLKAAEVLFERVKITAEKEDPESAGGNTPLAQIAAEMKSKGVYEFCYQILDMSLPFWKSIPKSTEKTNQSTSTDMSIFRKPWLPHIPLLPSSANVPAQGNSRNGQECYMSALTEVALQIPNHFYSIDKVLYEEKWYRLLCELVCLPDSQIHKISKRLLITLCHHDEMKYKTMKDKFKMQEQLSQLVKKYVAATQNVGGHQQLTDIVDTISAISSLATYRPDMWRDVCHAHITWLLRLAAYTTDVVASQVVDLIIIAVRDSSADGTVSIHLADSIIEAENGDLLLKIIRRFLIGKEEALRWTVHGLVRSIIQLASRQNQASLVRTLYQNIYAEARNMGHFGDQLVDIIGAYAPRLFLSTELVGMSNIEMKEIEECAKRLEDSGLAMEYRYSNDIGFGMNSIMMDAMPCLTCFSTKGALEVLKLSSIKSEIRYSTNALVYKLNSNYEISRVSLKLTDLKKSKSIKKVVLYYCPKTTDSIVDLKNNPRLWRQCAQTSMNEGDTQVNLLLAVPVVTSSLIVEFNEVVETQQQTQLHCPRCSAVVRSQSGNCENCGESAFQCTKCRAINYVDREPFLCQSCGFCKYARIETSVVGRQLPGAQFITSDAERQQCVEEMTKLLTKLETTRTKFRSFKVLTESIWFKSRPLPAYHAHVENSHVHEYFDTTGMVGLDANSHTSNIPILSQLGQTLKLTHQEIVTQTEQLMALHEELNRYDNAKETPVVLYKKQNLEYYSTCKSCFGCICNSIIHSTALLHSFCDDEGTMKNIIDTERVFTVIAQLSNKYEIVKDEIEELFVRLIFGRMDATQKVEKLIKKGEMDISIFAKTLIQSADSTWQYKLKFLIEYTMSHNDENCTLQTIAILNKYLRNSIPLEGKVEKTTNRIPTNEAIVRWLTTGEEWNDCCTLVASTSKNDARDFEKLQYQWLSKCLFSSLVNIRSAANCLLINFSNAKGHESVAVLILLECLQQLPTISPQVFDQFMQSANHIIGSSPNLKSRLFLERFHIYLIRQIHTECELLHKQEVSMMSDVTFGLRLRCYAELLNLMFSGSSIEMTLLKAGADDMLANLLQSTIFLKRLVTRRNRPVDTARSTLEKLLRRVSTKDGFKLMEACVETLKMKDVNSLGIVVSMMLEVMDPQTEVEEEFLIQIEKDSAQEDFLQGRMTGNPYSSNDSGMGPLMRDIKNKICRDTEMIALMEDDNGMELLVNGSIISLALPVRQVYDKLWRRQNGSNPMLIVYRMRGLLGDAVETFISSLGEVTGAGDTEENDALRLMTRCLVRCKGMDRLLKLLKSSNDTSSGRFLLGQLRRIFERIVKTYEGRETLVKNDMVRLMFTVIRECCGNMDDESKVILGTEFYKVVIMLLSDISIHEDLKGIEEADAEWFFSLYTNNNNTRRQSQLLDLMTPGIGNIVLGNDKSEDVLVRMYPEILKWEVIDAVDSSIGSQRNSIGNIMRREDFVLVAERLAVIIKQIKLSKEGKRLKQKILDSGIVTETCNYLLATHPPLLSPTESPEWKAFLVKPSLKLMLNILHGLAHGHEASQKAIAENTLPLLHRLEQVASENAIGTLAENVMDALKKNKDVEANIEKVRKDTKERRRQMAMAMRNKQLSKMGMQMGKAGEVKVSSRNLLNEPALEETESLVCCICRESAIRGDRIAAVYAFAAIDTEALGISPSVITVSQMVMVHTACHNSAIRRGVTSRNVDEWGQAMLHNAGARCNVLIPIATGIPDNDSWQTALTKCHTDIERICQIPGGITRHVVFVEMCRLVDRFVFKRSFSAQSNGGGRESNMQFLAILHLLGMSLPAEDDLPVTVPRHRLISFLFTEQTLNGWMEVRNDVLRATMMDFTTSGESATWENSKQLLFIWAFVNRYFTKVIPITGDDCIGWLREHLSETIHKTVAFVEDFDANVMVCATVDEFCDVAELPFDEVNQLIDAAPAGDGVPEIQEEH